MKLNKFQPRVQSLRAKMPKANTAKATTPYTVTPARTGRGFGGERGEPPHFHITRRALEDLIAQAASAKPEVGGLGFGAYDKCGVDTVEFDKQGSARASSSVYANDGPWCNARQQAHLHGTPVRSLQMAWHTHPGSYGTPSGKSGYAVGDMGMFEAIFEMNEWMQVLHCPILTHGRTADGKLTINLNPWVATREPKGSFRSIRVELAELVIHETTADLPPAIMNPAWEASLTPTVNPLAARDEYVSRIAGIVSPAMRDKTIMLIGTGGGSYFAEKLARYAPKKLILIDPDTISVSNLSRTNFTYQDATEQRFKTEALKARIEAINPFVTVESLPTTLAKLSHREVERLLDETDLIVEGTDSFESKKFTNEIARKNNIPALYIGIHAAAQSGRLIWYYPDVTPCYECVAWDRYQQQTSAVPLNLDGAAGAVADIQLVDMPALRIALAMLEAGQDSTSGRFFAQIKSQGSEIIVRASLESKFGGDLFAALFGDLPTTPKAYAAELGKYFVGMDVIALPVSPNLACPCQQKLSPVNSVLSEIFAKHNMSAAT